jgi:hypothetical protein
MNIQSENRYRQFFFEVNKVDKHWDSQVWFWKRRKIYRLRIATSDIPLGMAGLEEDMLKLLDGARNALHGVGYGCDYLTIAFKTKADAMLFKLTHEGSC